MAQLHIISKSPFSHQALSRALPFIAADDSIILIDDGTYGAVDNTRHCQQLAELNCACYALTPDLQARGIKAATHITAIDMNSFVDLTLAADNTVSWY